MPGWHDPNWRTTSLLPIYGLLQLLAVGLTFGIGAYAAGNSTIWFSIVFSIAFSHYLLALWYGRRRVVTVIRQPVSLAALGLALALGYGLYHGGFPLAAYFALHHAFNEVYLRNARLPAGIAQATGILRGAAITLHFTAVLLLIRSPQWLAYEPLLWGLLLASAALWLRELARYWPRLNATQRLDQVMLELILLALLPIAYFHPLTLVQVVCYHVIFWAFYPLIGFAGQRRVRPLLSYLALTGVTIGAFLAISPVGVYGWKVSPTLFYSQFILWSWLHITLAFATSSAHPRWITRWFAPRAPAPA